jgi:hypothetical protein
MKHSSKLFPADGERTIGMKCDRHPPVHCACTHYCLGLHAAAPRQHFERSARWASSAQQQLAAAVL